MDFRDVLLLISILVSFINVGLILYVMLVSLGYLVGTHDFSGNRIRSLNDELHSGWLPDAPHIRAKPLERRVEVGNLSVDKDASYELTLEGYKQAIADWKKVAAEEYDYTGFMGTMSRRDKNLRCAQDRIMMALAKFPEFPGELEDLRDRQNIVDYATSLKNVVYWPEERHVAISGTGDLSCSTPRDYLDF
jgi:hypothetical protein